MKVAVSSKSRGLESSASPVFGRCSYFVIAEIKNDKIVNTNSIENHSRRRRGGAGITAAELVGNQKVNAVITINIGPKAYDVLKRLGIKIYSGESGTVKKNIELLIKNKLSIMKTFRPGGFGRRRGRGRR